jgi:hypothetical protein
MESAFAGYSLYMLGAILLWTFPWKAWALWLAARRGDIWWFLALLLLNTLAILDIIYIFVVAKQKDVREGSQKTDE